MLRKLFLLILQSSLLLSGHFDNLENNFVEEDSVAPALDITVEYNEEDEDDPEPKGYIGEDYTFHPNHKIRLDPFTLHHPMHSSNIMQFEFSDWYFLFFKPVSNSSHNLSSFLDLLPLPLL